MKVTLDKCNTRIRIRFRYEGTSHQKYVGSHENPNDWAAAELLAKQIETDAKLGRFDETLEKYFPSKKSRSRNDDLLTRLKARRDEQYNDVEAGLISLVEQFGPINSKTAANRFVTWLLEERKIKKSSCNRYLSSLRIVARDLFEDLRVKVPARKPDDAFTRDEVQAILDSFRSNEPHFHDYVFLLLNTGMRPSEAIGLRWKDIDFSTPKINLAETLKRNKGNSSKRIRSTTKTNKFRIVPLNPATIELLRVRKATSKTDLIFTSPKGHPIDDHAFCCRQWRKCLKAAEVPYRRPYITRHTFISTMLSIGHNPVEIAKITGHDPRLMFEKYANVIRPVTVPNLW
jgi:integrase